MKGLLIGLLVSSVLLVGCGSDPDEGKRKVASTYQEPAKVEAPAAPAAGAPPFFQEIFQKDSDGRTVRCFYKVASVHQGGGPTMDCDWAGAIVHK